MELHGVSSGDLDVKSPAEKFFRSVTDDINGPFDNIEDKMETMNLEDRTLTMRMSGCLISESYKTVKATITVSPKEDGEGSCVAWKVEFEKIRHDIEDPHLIIDTLIDVLVNYLKETDGNLLL
ncbi:Uncharacterized protein Rs2_45882 [Raphanus sativus]|uniref:Uncharacterized protein At1g24000-like n=1 Tax=Raphanus sativus TaxID=3726 RepID=A0A9W3CM57_RAPSA|nr:uncharacterized protein At1g24000-like [Raphanus sativus]KAJ4872456.1 Uncharacterized protein Rs2_45882 [Raphanus sativus]